MGSDSVCEMTKSTDTPDRRKGDKTASRNCPVYWIGTSTSRWEMDAGDKKVNPTNDDVILQCEFTARLTVEEPRDWSQLVAVWPVQ